MVQHLYDNEPHAEPNRGQSPLIVLMRNQLLRERQAKGPLRSAAAHTKDYLRASHLNQLREERPLLRKVGGRGHQDDVHPLDGGEELLNAAYFREQA